MTHAENFLSRRRNNMYKKYPYCRYCGIKTLLDRSLIDKTGGLVPWDYATVEHVYPKTDLRRYCRGGNNILTIACRKCNEERGRKDAHLNYLPVRLDIFRLFNIIPFNENE